MKTPCSAAGRQSGGNGLVRFGVPQLDELKVAVLVEREEVWLLLVHFDNEHLFKSGRYVQMSGLLDYQLCPRYRLLLVLCLNDAERARRRA